MFDIKTEGKFMKPFLVIEANDIVELKVICVGVGGAGCNIINHLFNKALVNIDLIAIDADNELLEQLDNVKKIYTGLKYYDKLKTAFLGADIIFITAGFGGVTGTATSQIVAKIAKEIDALTISIVTMPFKFEGRARSELAESGLDKIKKESDSVVIIDNEKLLPSIDKNINFKEALKVIDIAVEEVINGIMGLIIAKGENDINLDFADIQAIMSHKGMALMGIGKSEGEDSANKAIKQAMEYASLENKSLCKVSGILIQFNVHPDFPIMEIAEAMEIIHEDAHDDADILFGTTTDKSLTKEYVKVTMILTGFDEDVTVNNINYTR